MSKPISNYPKLLTSVVFKFLRDNKYFPFNDDIINIIFTYYTPPSKPFSSLGEIEQKGILKCYNEKSIQSIRKFKPLPSKYEEWYRRKNSNDLINENIKDENKKNLNDYLISEIYSRDITFENEIMIDISYIALTNNGYYIFLALEISKSIDDSDVEFTIIDIIVADFIADIYLYIAPVYFNYINGYKCSEMIFIENYDYNLKYINVTDIINDDKFHKTFNGEFLHFLKENKTKLKLERLYYCGVGDCNFIFRLLDGSWLITNHLLYNRYYPSFYSVIEHLSIMDELYPDKFYNRFKQFQLNFS